MGWVDVGAQGDFPDSIVRAVDAEGALLAVVRVGAAYYAFDNFCTHIGVELVGSSVGLNSITCWWHGSKFQLTTGEVLNGPARKPLATYATKVEDGRLYVAQQ